MLYVSLNKQCILRHLPESSHWIIVPQWRVHTNSWLLETQTWPLQSDVRMQWSLSPSTSGSEASRKTARLRKGSSDRWNLNLKLMRRVSWSAMLSLLMKAEGNRSRHGPNRCSLIRVPSACYAADTLMTFKETIPLMEGGKLQNDFFFFFFYSSIGEIRDNLKRFLCWKAFNYKILRQLHCDGGYLVN